MKLKRFSEMTGIRLTRQEDNENCYLLNVTDMPQSMLRLLVRCDDFDYLVASNRTGTSISALFVIAKED